MARIPVERSQGPFSWFTKIFESKKAVPENTQARVINESGERLSEDNSPSLRDRKVRHLPEQSTIQSILSFFGAVDTTVSHLTMKEIQELQPEELKELASRQGGNLPGRYLVCLTKEQVNGLIKDPEKKIHDDNLKFKMSPNNKKLLKIMRGEIRSDQINRSSIQEKVAYVSQSNLDNVDSSHFKNYSDSDISEIQKFSSDTGFFHDLLSNLNEEQFDAIKAKVHFVSNDKLDYFNRFPLSAFSSQFNNWVIIKDVNPMLIRTIDFPHFRMLTREQLLVLASVPIASKEILNEKVRNRLQYISVDNLEKLSHEGIVKLFGKDFEQPLPDVSLYLKLSPEQQAVIIPHFPEMFPKSDNLPADEVRLVQEP